MIFLTKNKSDHTDRLYLNLDIYHFTTFPLVELKNLFFYINISLAHFIRNFQTMCMYKSFRDIDPQKIMMTTNLHLIARWLYIYAAASSHSINLICHKSITCSGICTRNRSIILLGQLRVSEDCSKIVLLIELNHVSIRSIM
jgi:hypothetical protein